MQEEELGEKEQSEAGTPEFEDEPARGTTKEPTENEEEVETSKIGQDEDEDEDNEPPLKGRLRSSRTTDQVADPAEEPKDSPLKTQPKASARSESEEPEKEDIDEATYQLERKRKGKMPAQPAKKKVRRANTTVIIQEPIQVSFGQKENEEEELTEPEESSSAELYTISEEIPNPNDNVSLVDEVESLERITYEKILVELDDELLAEMKTFEDPNLQARYNQMDAKSKGLRSGKMIHIPSLDEVSARTTLFDYIERIGFGWILNIDETEVPVNLAREFFTSFRFRITTDLDEPSIRFRVFGIELEMSVTEWTVRMGICTLPEAVSAEWRSRERGVPIHDISFDVKDAWKALTHNHSKQYQATKS